MEISLENSSNLEKDILFIIKRSKVPEDLLHAKDTLKILLILNPTASYSLRIAALGHDIERALPNGIRAHRGSFPSYNIFKLAHSENSARVLKGLILKHGFPIEFANKVAKIVLAHEFGGFLEADLLKDADSLSFFHTNLYFYKQREPEKEVRRRIRWGLMRLSKRAFNLLPKFAKDSLLFDEINKFLLVR